MKKKLLTLSLMFVFMFIININKVEGVTCEYGIKETDNDTWEHKITLDMWNYNSFMFNTNSPIYSNFEDVDNGTANVPAHGNAMYRYYVEDNGDKNYLIYVQFFINEQAYKDAGMKCPDAINYKLTYTGVANDYYHLALYTDDLAFQNIKYGDDDDSSDGGSESDDAASAFGFDKTKGRLISKEVSNKPLNEVIDVYGCYTYSIYYKAMVEAKNANGGNCDGSREFTDNYTELQDLCTAYRSSESYVTVSGDNVSISSGCQKACTNLKDDVAGLCDFKNDGYCGSLSSKVVTYIFKLFGIVRYIIPALLVILSVLEYIKAVASDSDDEMKKVSGRFVKRLLAAALIILIPLVIDFILGLFDIPGLSATEPFCNK